MAKQVAISKDDARSFRIGCVGIRADGAIVKSSNGPVVMQNNDKSSYPAAHAEYRAAKKLDVGAIVFVCRVRKIDGTFAFAKPCKDCQRTLRSKGVKKVYYTINDNEYGVMFLNKRKERNDGK